MSEKTKTSTPEKNWMKLIYAVSALVFLIVVLLRILPKPEVLPVFAQKIPGINACINFTCSVLLMLSFYFVRKKKINIHKNLNITSFLLSSIFLILYVIYHALAEETKFPADNPLRNTYLFILITHIILAAGVLPFILITFYRGLNMQVEKHRKIARWAFPIWLYVTVTGVLVYLMISPYYPF